ncbi:ATP-binding protein [Streptomyces sp. NPDC052000]|uniref:ATP-binding protein n=1 Tax=Streptomyces sp. NPDC052000 TaxID=3155676 RepID=UPI00344DFDFD
MRYSHRCRDTCCGWRPGSPSNAACSGRSSSKQVALEEFGFTASCKLRAVQIRDRGALRWLHAGASVILFGPVGVGKTHVAQALGHLAVHQGAHVPFAKTGRSSPTSPAAVRTAPGRNASARATRWAWARAVRTRTASRPRSRPGSAPGSRCRATPRWPGRPGRCVRW